MLDSRYRFGQVALVDAPVSVRERLVTIPKQGRPTQPPPNVGR